MLDVRRLRRLECQAERVLMDEQLINSSRDLLTRWESGAIHSAEVHKTAEQWYGAISVPQYPESDHRSIPIELLTNLDALNHQLIGRCDVPAMLAFLGTAPGDELESWARWRAYWSHVDLDERERQRGAGMYFPD